MRGILFNYELGMFTATIEGRKTETRRLNDNYKVGEILYLKEPYIESGGKIYYKYNQFNEKTFSMNAHCLEEEVGWKNKLFMPARLGRHFIQIVAKRREPLHNITNESAIAEGVEVIKTVWGVPQYRNYLDKNNDAGGWPCISYQTLWEKINGKDSWSLNPDVVVYTYKLIDNPNQ